jgi:hypothetical protein
MPIFKLNARVTVSAYTEVDADSLEDAIKIATKRDVALGGPGNDSYPDESWIIDDADGVPRDITD